MITIDQTPTQRSAGQHKAARRALVGWKLHRVGGRRRAGVPVAVTPAVPSLEQLERAERYHTFGITR